MIKRSFHFEAQGPTIYTEVGLGPSAFGPFGHLSKVIIDPPISLDVGDLLLISTVGDAVVSCKKCEVIKLATNLAIAAHEGQFRRDGKTPQITHPFTVADWDGFTTVEKAAAILHDVVEDTDYSLEDLAEAGIPECVLTIVDALTKRPGESYDDFIDRIVNSSVSACLVKYRDIVHNLSDHPTPKQMKKYGAALVKLADAVGYRG
jgi:(p)ppGpp synthase/HD superfamily hydrolase